MQQDLSELQRQQALYRQHIHRIGLMGVPPKHYSVHHRLLAGVCWSAMMQVQAQDAKKEERNARR